MRHTLQSVAEDGFVAAHVTQAAGVDDANAEVDAWRECKYTGCE